MGVNTLRCFRMLGDPQLLEKSCRGVSTRSRVIDKPIMELL